MQLLQQFDGFIFDCDGVLVDSEPLSCNALNIVFENEFGIDIGRDYTPVLGTSLEYAINYYLDKYGITTNEQVKLMELKEQAYFDQAQSSLKSFPNIDNVIQKLRDSGKYLGVASSGSLQKIEFSLNTVNLLSQFQHLTSSSEVVRGKPFPDLFLHAIKKAKLDPKKCVVIEDSVHGVKAAKKAGCHVIGFGTSFSAEDLYDAGADLYLNRYSSLLDLL